MASKGDNTLKKMVQSQVTRVLERGTRDERFDQLRSRHFWSTYLFIADTATNIVPAGDYDLFKTIPGQSGQGYPTNVALTLRETNWLNAGRVPDNQNFVITEIGCTIKRPPATDLNTAVTLVPAAAPTNGIWANLTAAQQAYITAGSQAREINHHDALQIANGFVLQMSFLTNNVPIGLVSDFSQSAGALSTGFNAGIDIGGDPLNGVGAAIFRRKLEVPILLQHGENMGMRLSSYRPIEITAPGIAPAAGTGWFEIRVDWWAHESFAEKS